MATPKSGPRISSARGFIDAAFKQPADPNYFYAYRGHRSEDYDILPSVLRTPQGRRQERRIFQELLATSSNEFQPDQNAFQRLVRAQHYGLPTRLLEVTLNPLVALYFATEDLSTTETDQAFSPVGEVIAFKVRWEDVKYSDSDAVSCIANMAYMTNAERRDLRVLGRLSKEDYNKEAVVDRLRQFVRAEKPGFRPEIEPLEVRNTYFVNPRDSNNRMIAQAGKFLIFGERVGYDHIIDDFTVNTFKISPPAKTTIRAQLDTLSINGRTLFPEVESAARYIRAKFLT
jgi:hypothetical protein